MSRVRVELLRGGAGPAELIANDIDATLASYAWIVTGPAAAGSVIVITDTSDPTVSGSSDPFDIMPAGVYLFEPSGGEYLSTGTSRDITWLADAALAAGIVNVRIEISRDNGVSWTEDIVASTDASTGSYSWTVADGGLPLPQTQCLVRVSDAAAAGVQATTAGFIVYSGVLHVDIDASSGGDGLSWATAFRHPQDAMDVALPGAEVWVAEGTYTRRVPEDTVLVTMAEGVAIYGGFVGNEAARAGRDWSLHEVVLDGEDVCEHVVVAAEGALLDGLSVERGAAMGGGGSTRGGGVFGELVSFDLANCRFKLNGALIGGGVFVESSDVGVAGCIFDSNLGELRGGGICAQRTGLTLTGSVFKGNTTPNWGGAVYVYDSTILLVGSLLVGNDAGGGGGLFCEVSSTSAVSCSFVGNSAYRGGGIRQDGGGLTLTNCSFSGNAASYGGGAYSKDSFSGQVTNCVFWGNTAMDGPQLEMVSPASVVVNYSNVEGGWTGTGNIGGDLVNDDPLFVDPDGPDNIPGTEDDDLRLQAGSPCIDAADGDAAPALDLDGNARADDPATADTGVGTPPYADMGAYEYQP